LHIDENVGSWLMPVTDTVSPIPSEGKTFLQHAAGASGPALAAYKSEVIIQSIIHDFICHA
jgi:hypothetical protein